jgi:GNAT superfamily N-acetyltransferase
MTANLNALRAKARKIVVPYSETYANSHTAFASRMWNKRRRREPVYQRWKFRGPEQGPVPGLLLAVLQGEVVGQTGLIPVRARVGGREQQAQWVCDLMVDERVRGTGIGAMLLVAATDRPCLTLGSNPSPLAGSMLTSFGFQRLRGPLQMLLPLRPEHLISWFLTGASARLIPLASALARPLVGFRNRKLWMAKRGADYSFCRWQDLPDRIAESEKSLVEPHIVHDAEFLAWRCGAVPGFCMELSGVRSRLGGWAVVGDANPFCYVFDWHASNSADGLCLVRGIHDYARSIKSCTVKMNVDDDGQRKWLSGFGFIPRRHPNEIHAFPKLEPPDSAGFFRYALYDSDENL